MFVSDYWDQMFYRGAGFKAKVSPLTDPVMAEVVEVKNRPTDMVSGEAIQGEDQCYIIFKVDDRYFMKTGHQDSYEYESVIWTPGAVEVFPETKTVTVYDTKR